MVIPGGARGAHKLDAHLGGVGMASSLHRDVASDRQRRQLPLARQVDLCPLCARQGQGDGICLHRRAGVELWGEKRKISAGHRLFNFGTYRRWY